MLEGHFMMTKLPYIIGPTLFSISDAVILLLPDEKLRKIKKSIPSAGQPLRRNPRHHLGRLTPSS